MPRRQLLLGLVSLTLLTACADTPSLPTPPPAAQPSPEASPSPTTGMPPVAQAAGSPVATSVQIQRGPPLIVPGREASPAPAASPGIVGPGAGASPSPAASPSARPIALDRPGLLAVERSGRILLVDPERQQPTRTLLTRTDNAAPIWSPDGRSVLVVGGGGPAAELYVVTANGAQTRRLTGNARPERGAAWSPDGTRVAYALPRDLGPGGENDPSEPEEVWLLDLQTGSDRKLVDGFDPSWSPDGRWLAYASNGQRDLHGPRDNAIRIVGADGQGDRDVLSVSDVPVDLLPGMGLPFRPQTIRLRAPSWSPDGLLLVASADGHTSFAVTFDERGRAVRPWALAYEGGVGRARWSPDGARLAVESRPATAVAVVVLVEVGVRRETVVGGPSIGFQASGPAWAPDGRRLALVASTLPARRDTPVETALRLFTPEGASLGDLIAEPGLRSPDWGRA